MRNNTSAFFLGALVLAVAIALPACRSAQKPRAHQNVVPADQEKQLVSKLDQNIFAAHGHWKDESAERIINGMLEYIGGDELKGARVRLLETNTPYIAPGLDKTIYISRGALATVYYENELAFLLATELSFLKETVTSRNLINLQAQEVGENIMNLPTAPPSMQTDYLASGWFDAGGLFDFGSFAYLKAEQEGIKLMYAAKYDPRGAVTLIQRWTSPALEERMRALGKILPESDERLNAAREEVAKLSPVRDPIVKSHAFEELQSRLHVKKAKTKKRVNK